MDFGVIFTLIGSTIAIIGIMIAMMFWGRSESIALRSEANADRREIMSLLLEMKDEMKDFHSRLLILEERYLQLREKK